MVKTVRGRTSETKVPFHTTISQCFCHWWAWETEDQWGTRPCWSLTLLSESLCWPAAPQLGLSDYRPLALTSVVMKILQETGLDLLDRHICYLQFACWAQRSVYDAGNMVVQHTKDFTFNSASSLCQPPPVRWSQTSWQTGHSRWGWVKADQATGQSPLAPCMDVYSSYFPLHWWQHLNRMAC